MTVLLIIALVLTAGTLMRNMAYWVRIWRQPELIARERRTAENAARPSAGPRIELHYVIPAFQEVDALPTTFRALQRSIEASSYDATITVVTSVHDEPRFSGERRTRQVADELCARVANARVVVDGAAVPSMAAAFNTGTRDVARLRQDAEGTVYVAVYNADSSATQDSVQALGDTIISRDYPEVLQLNHSSMRNVESMTGISGWYARGAAYYQTRWALGFEFDLHRRNSRPIRSGPLGHSYHLKGHGLVLRLDTALSVEGFSTQTPCEDLELGFRLAMQRIPVHSVPVLEDTESPSTTAAVIAQKRYWFSGMIDVFHFHHLQPELKRAEPVRFELARAASLYRSAGCFLLAPLPYWFSLAASVVLGAPAFLLVPVANAVISTSLIRRALRRLGAYHASLCAGTLLADIAAVAVWSMTRNIGPLLYLAAMIRQRDRIIRMRAAHMAHVDESAATARGPV